jgi:hypothetical protein
VGYERRSGATWCHQGSLITLRNVCMGIALFQHYVHVSCMCKMNNSSVHTHEERQDPQPIICGSIPSPSGCTNVDSIPCCGLHNLAQLWY